MSKLSNLENIRDNMHRKGYCRAIGCESIESLADRVLQIVLEFGDPEDDELIHDVLFRICSRLVSRYFRKEPVQGNKKFDKTFKKLCKLKAQYWRRVCANKGRG